MIKARIRWCTCRVENILTLGKLLSLWFCFLLHSILFLISQTSYRTYKIISSYELRSPCNGNHFSSKYYMHEHQDRSFNPTRLYARVKIQKSKVVDVLLDQTRPEHSEFEINV